MEGVVVVQKGTKPWPLLVEQPCVLLSALSFCKLSRELQVLVMFSVVCSIRWPWTSLILPPIPSLFFFFPLHLPSMFILTFHPFFFLLICFLTPLVLLGSTKVSFLRDGSFRGGPMQQITASRFAKHFLLTAMPCESCCGSHLCSPWLYDTRQREKRRKRKNFPKKLGVFHPSGRWNLGM